MSLPYGPDICYTQRPDRKGTERVSCAGNGLSYLPHVTLKDPIERGLKDCIRCQEFLIFSVFRYTQRPDRKGTERPRSLASFPSFDIYVTLKDPIERGLKVFLLPKRKRHPDLVTLKDPIERGLKGAGL